ncbi:uncharacterized protein MELLADRAFT_88683 [Melampsora larici-populina 98AG31]|uniref:Uncharacterized protein n=1 Tax=Melampsora larici-populina (strain 98AG31 / pathotype 3-4-7) TaxID=747676 RepID=F4RSL4_MELLP|nr:uncharacterized protein MELLADRAFT_88683 [Melampsora larici-populina 98AG31]EGG04672.1 hypothetical protein MELLADRAFT_88683 [Melampsora larici-populina 98AG31]
MILSITHLVFSNDEDKQAPKNDFDSNEDYGQGFGVYQGKSINLNATLVKFLIFKRSQVVFGLNLSILIQNLIKVFHFQSIVPLPSTFSVFTMLMFENSDYD